MTQILAVLERYTFLDVDKEWRETEDISIGLPTLNLTIPVQFSGRVIQWME